MLKILIDNNLPQLISKKLPNFECKSVREVLSADAKDKSIFEYCIDPRINILMTKDKNFAWLINNSKNNLKVILLQTGNISINNLLTLISEKHGAIEYFSQSKDKILII